MRRVLISGCGYIGCRLAELLLEDGVDVWGIRRDVSRLPPGVRGVAADVVDPGTLEGLPRELDGLVHAVSPGGRTPEAYRDAYVIGLGNVLEAAGGGAPAGGRVVLVSSTGVYGHTDGRRVDEETPPEPASATAEVLLEGEALARDAGTPGIVLRLGGIYGPGRTRTIRRVLAGEAGCPPPDRHGNRIHRDDAAGALRHLLTLERPHELYLGVDREPAPLREVYRWIARRAGVADPCGEQAAASREPRRRRSNKRCSSDRLAASGYEFRYPSFREGYGELLDSMPEAEKG